MGRIMNLAPFEFPRTKILSSFRAERAVALTFDDGPDPDFTPRVLDILRRHCAKATFFVLGRQAELYPRILREIIESGSEVANHSYSHPSFSALSSYSRFWELRNCERAIGRNCKKYFRPPYGHGGRLTPLLASMLGYVTIGWSVDVSDWEISSAETIAQALADKVKPGAIVLLHDRLENAKDFQAFDRSNMLAGLDAFLGNFASAYSFQTISEVLSSGEAVFGHAWDVGLSRSQMETIRRDLSVLIQNA